jgi:hypothetical protein
MVRRSRGGGDVGIPGFGISIISTVLLPRQFVQEVERATHSPATIFARVQPRSGGIH